MNLLEQALQAHLAPDGLELDCIESVHIEGVLTPGVVQCTVRYVSRWNNEAHSMELQHKGYQRAVELLRQTGREELAGELERAWK